MQEICACKLQFYVHDLTRCIAYYPGISAFKQATSFNIAPWCNTDTAQCVGHVHVLPVVGLTHSDRITHRLHHSHVEPGRDYPCIG